MELIRFKYCFIPPPHHVFLQILHMACYCTATFEYMEVSPDSRSSGNVEAYIF